MVKEHRSEKMAPITVTVTVHKADGTPVEDDDPLASVTVKLVVMDEETCASWDNTKFVESMGKKQKAGMQVENGIFELTKGRGVHDKARIKKKSTKHEVKLGVMMHACKRDIEETRVIEGVSNLFRVKDRTENTQNKRKKTEGTAQHQNNGHNLVASVPMETDSEFSVDEYLDDNEKLKSLVTHILSKSLNRVLKEFPETTENTDIFAMLHWLRNNLENLKQQLTTGQERSQRSK
ncbi:hypothetical protein U9M48_041477 [Paspalum notatum var. saurae]|uniref:Uncharacterized protein n=1 Tax=Paspalum notatum var. saurae TaxID=547442 RepID=A0AAQ3UQM8_PASNO